MKLQGLSNEISLAKKAAKESGNLLISNKAKINYRVDSNPKDIKLKADIDSENLIKTIISNESTFPILAEESGKSKEELGNVFWVIDPLDGTANFSRDIPICCISIGLIMNKKPILGVIYDFNNDHMYVGDALNKKSVMNDQTIKVSNITDKKDGILITGLPHNSDYSK